MGARRALWRVDGERGKAAVRYILCSWLKSVRGEGGSALEKQTNKYSVPDTSQRVNPTNVH